MIIADREFCKDDRFYIFGILNVTPDSFSDGGRFIIDGKVNKDRVLPTVEKMIGEGMDIVDVGGESTRPGYTLISDEEEIERTAPVIEAIKKNFDIPISLDTYKGAVAKAGIEAGADLINDIWGFKYSPDMADIVAKAGVSCCLMQNRKDTNYVNFSKDVVSDLRESVEIAVKAGISRDRIMIDPGVGFAKSYEQNLEIINRLDELCKLELPILLGTSRKSVIGLTLDLPSSERVEGTVATSVIGALKGARFFRVHDIKENRRALDMTRAILSQGV